MEKDDLMCLGCFWSCCARAAGLCVHLASEALGMCHFAVMCTSTLQPRDLGLTAHGYPAHVRWLFLKGFPTPCSQKSRQTNTVQREKENKMRASNWIWAVFAGQFSPPCDPELSRQCGVLVRFQGWGCLTVVTGAEVPPIPGSPIRHQGWGRQEDR